MSWESMGFRALVRQCCPGLVDKGPASDATATLPHAVLICSASVPCITACVRGGGGSCKVLWSEVPPLHFRLLQLGCRYMPVRTDSGRMSATLNEEESAVCQQDDLELHQVHHCCSLFWLVSGWHCTPRAVCHTCYWQPTAHCRPGLWADLFVVCGQGLQNECRSVGGRGCVWVLERMEWWD